MELKLEGTGNPYKDACAEARDVVIENETLKPRPADTQLTGIQGHALALRGDTLVAQMHATRGLSWGDVAIFLPGWHVHTPSGIVTLSQLSPPTIQSIEPYYPYLLTTLNWTLAGAAAGVNRVVNPRFEQGSTGWTTIKGNVQYGWTGTGGYAAWIRGAGDTTPPYPSYAGFRSQPIPIDRTKSYTLQLDTICEPYDRYTYDNQPPRIIVRLWQYAASNPIGNALITYQSDQAHATGARGVWHRHPLFVDVIAPHNSNSFTRWDSTATHAVIEVFCNMNKQRFTNIQLIEGGQPTWRVENNRRIARWTLNPTPEPTPAEVFTTGNFQLTDTYSLRLAYLAVRGAESLQDDSVRLVIEDESGERYEGRILAYRSKHVQPSTTINTLLYEDVEFDTAPVRDKTVTHIGLTLGIQQTDETPTIEIGSPLASDENEERFALYKHGGIPRGRATYLLTQAQNVSTLRYESSPAETSIPLSIFNYHAVRINALANSELRLYRLVGGGYQLVASRSNSGELIDMGNNIGEPYIAGGLLPQANTGVVWGGRVAVAQTNTPVLYLSGQNQPLSFAETQYRDEDPFTVVFPEHIRALTADEDALRIYTQSKLYRITRFVPTIILEEHVMPPDTDKLCHSRVVVARNSVYIDSRLLKTLPQGFTAGFVRLGQDGTLFIAHANQPLAYLLTPSGWVRWTLPVVAQDAIMVRGIWHIVSEEGCYRLADSQSKVNNAIWVSGYFAEKGKSRPVYLWLRGSATVIYRDGNNTRQKRLHNERWQVPVPETARAWQLALELQPDDAVYALDLLATLADTK